MLRRLLREPRRPSAPVKASALVVALSAAAGLATAQESGSGPTLEVLKRLDLPREVARAADVRWWADDEIVLGVIGGGVHAWRLGDSGAELRVALEEPEPDVREIGGRRFLGPSHDRDYGRLAVSPLGIAFADLFGGVHVATEAGISDLTYIEFLGDLDREGTQTAATGLLRNEDDAWAPYAAWLIEDAGGTPRGLLPTRDGGRALESCSDAELSVIRFLSDDRLLVIPGAEAGVFVYGRDGTLHDSLDAATFLAESGCGVETDEWGNSPLSDAYARADWLGPRRIIDEVIADGVGNVYFFVRYAAAGEAEELAVHGDAPLLRGPRAEAALTSTLPNTTGDCSVPLCHEPAAAGRIPAREGQQLTAASGRAPAGFGHLRHHVALRSGPKAEGRTGQSSRFRGSRRQESQGQNNQPSRQNVDRIRAGSVDSRVVASAPPPRGRVCWDLVHARVDSLRTVATRPCVVESEFADTRLRADLQGDRVVILLRGGALRGADVRTAEALEARLLPPTGAGN